MAEQKRPCEFCQQDEDKCEECHQYSEYKGESLEDRDNVFWGES